tara:strand:- start:981 stop:1247 length:267 start_codon:yes stop_codon:yes gene_type:complete
MKTEQLTPREIDWDNGYAAGLIDGRKGKKALEARIAQLEALLTESADDIEGEANMRWLTRHLSDREMRAYNRDMDLPNRIRAALKAGG